MNYFKKPISVSLILIISIFFTNQCTSVGQGSIIRTEKRVIENANTTYEYRFEVVSVSNLPNSEAIIKAVKIPRRYIEKTNIYQKVKKYDRWKTAGLGLLAPALVTAKIISDINKDRGFPGNPTPGITLFCGTILFGVIMPLISKNHEKPIGEIAETQNVFEAISDATPLPLPNQPVEIIWYTGEEIKTFKTFTNNEGFIKLNPHIDFNISNSPKFKTLSLAFYYINSETGVKESRSVNLKLQ